jgi:hypothetical protein
VLQPRQQASFGLVSRPGLGVPSNPQDVLVVYEYDEAAEPFSQYLQSFH